AAGADPARRRRFCRHADAHAAPACRAARRAHGNAMSDPRVAEALARLPDYLGSHVLVSLTALALGLIVSLPLAVAAARRPTLRAVVLAATSVVQTIPGLALLALFYPLLVGLAGLSESMLGVSFS